ncbi:MAG: cupin domain-containing protein [Arachidicoccus sp.]|nr:cupin domain-containing protein [Arachidicoccus sp.]
MNDNSNFYHKTAPHNLEYAGEGATREIIAYDNQLMMVKVSFEKGAIGTMHQHIHTQATFVESGVFEFTIGEEKQIIKQGDACFMPSNVLHGCVCLEAGALIDSFGPYREDFV